MPYDPANPGGQTDNQFPGIAGEKYGNDPSKVVDGYNHLYNLSLETYRENERLKQQLAERETGPLPDYRPDPQERSNAREQLEQVGVPVDAMEGIVRESIEKYLNPVLEGAKARQYIANAYPEFGKHENDVAAYVQENPELRAEYARAYSASPRVAMEWAYNQYAKAHTQPGSVSGAADQARARLDATLHAGGGGDRTNSVQTPEDQQLAGAWNHWMQTGDGEPYMRMKTRRVVPSGHIDGSMWGGPTG